MEHPGALLTVLSASVPSFLQPPPSLHSDSLAYLKAILDPLATNVATAQKLRRDGNRKKRKRSDVERDAEILQLRQLYTQGIGIKQVWEQTRRILDATCLEVESEIEIASQKSPQKSSRQQLDARDIQTRQTAEENEGESDYDSADEDAIDDSDLEGSISEEQSADEDSVPLDYEDMDDIEDNEDADAASDDVQKSPGTYIQDPNNLNDGFFSIDDFNRQTQFLEQQDARGEDDNPSDEDEIDWDADPLTMPFHKSKGTDGPHNTTDQVASEAEEESDDEEGPTFGNADLNADDSDEDMMDPEDGAVTHGFAGLDNTNDIRYADFFAPPAKKLSKTKRMRALPKTQPKPETSTLRDGETDADLQRAISDVRRDLLESEDEDEESEVDSDADMDGPRLSTKNMSTHEKQRAVIAAEIRRLEAANVSKRDWTLSGEARAAERPLNSLIEEDLEFERVGKPVPVITAEVSEEIEQLIKRRILAREFDEVIRRRPDALGGASESRRGRIDLDDTKPQSGLAEIYEQDHLKSTDPGYVDKRSAATKKQHDEISRLWKDVSAQLDLLSNLHFKPKRTEVEIKAVEDKPTISMEDARPVGAGANAEESMLAPQEVYRPGEDGRKIGDMVVRKGGASMHKEEMTREEKLRRRRREKERTKKAQSSGSASAAVVAADGRDAKSKKSKPKGKEQQKADILSELRKGNVKVLDKKGALQDLDSKKGRGYGNALAGGALKL